MNFVPHFVLIRPARVEAEQRIGARGGGGRAALGLADKLLDQVGIDGGQRFAPASVSENPTMVRDVVGRRHIERRPVHEAVNVRDQRGGQRPSVIGMLLLTAVRQIAEEFRRAAAIPAVLLHDHRFAVVIHAGIADAATQPIPERLTAVERIAPAAGHTFPRRVRMKRHEIEQVLNRPVVKAVGQPQILIRRQPGIIARDDHVTGGDRADDIALAFAPVVTAVVEIIAKIIRARVERLLNETDRTWHGSLYPELVKRQSGGSGPIYLASLLVQLATRNEKIDKNEGQESIAVAHNVSGVTLSAMTVKNRFIPAFLKAELYNNFRTGLSRYAGLADMAVAFGVITQTGSTFQFQGEKIGYRKTWENDTEFWDNKVLPVLEETLKEKVGYGSSNPVLDEAEKLTKE